MRKLFSIAASAVALLAIGSASAGGQFRERVVVTPYIGYFTPATDLGVWTEEGTLVTGKEVLEARPAAAFGLTASYKLAPRVALEIGGAFSASRVRSTFSLVSSGGAPVVGVLSEDARVIFGAAKLLVNALPEGSRFNVRLGAGPAIISHGGDAYKHEGTEISGLTDVGMAASLCTRIPLVSNLSLRLRAESFMYQAKLRFEDLDSPAGSYSYDKKFQSDLIFSAGFQMPIGR